MPESIPLLHHTVGWALLLAGFLSGALLGMGFHKDAFLGGYGEFRRRLLRLGHIACAALGILNLAYAASPFAAAEGAATWAASVGLIAGGALMPTVCFLTAWKRDFRHLFALPVIALFTGACAALVAPHLS